MNLNQMSEEMSNVVGKSVGFVIVSESHPDRKYKVEAKLSTGKFAIVRISDGNSYLVDGNADRYGYTVDPSRLSVLAGRRAELQNELNECQLNIKAITQDLERETTSSIELASRIDGVDRELAGLN